MSEIMPVDFERPLQFRDPELAFNGEVVGFYTREFYVLDNFSAFQLEWRGRLWPTNEHAYHAEKFYESSPWLVKLIADCRSPHAAFKLAHEHADQVREDWDEVKVAIMLGICRAKVMQHPYVLAKLLQTGTMPIVEDSPKDDFWGWGPNRDGRNELGKIWMQIREEVRELSLI